jgi:hypothetical protein
VLGVLVEHGVEPRLSWAKGDEEWVRGEWWPGPRNPSVVNLLQICVLSTQRKAVSLFTEPIVGRRKADEQEQTCFCADTHMRISSMASRTGAREFKMAMQVV